MYAWLWDRKEKGREASLNAVFQLSSVQNHQYAKAMSLGWYVLIPFHGLQDFLIETWFSCPDRGRLDVWVVFRMYLGMASGCGKEVLHLLLHLLYFSEGNGIGFQAWTRELTFTFAVLACPICPFPQSFLLSSTDYLGRHRWIIFLRWHDSLFSL